MRASYPKMKQGFLYFRVAKLVLIFSIFLTCKPNADKSNSSLGQEKNFYRLERCQRQLCVRSLISHPSQVDPNKEFKYFDTITIQFCELKNIPQLQTAACKDLKSYKASSTPTEQFSFIDLEQQYLIQENSLLLDQAIDRMNFFVEESEACQKSGFLSSYHGSDGAEFLKKLRHEYFSILRNIVSFFHEFLRGNSNKKTTEKLNLFREEVQNHGTGLKVKDRINPELIYYLEVRKFEPKFTIGVDFSWFEIQDISLSTLADIQNTIKELVNNVKTMDNISLKKFHNTTVAGLQVAKDLWTGYPLGTFNHIGVTFSPKEIIDGIDQFINIATKKGQFERVEHPTIDPIKYAWQIFHGHTLGHLGTAVVALGDIRKYANSGLGAYTSLAYIVRKGSKDGPIIDSFVYPYRRQDHGLISIEELEELYKGNFSSIETSQPFKGSMYIDFIEKYKDQYIDEVARASRLQYDYLNKVEGLLDNLAPPVDIDGKQNENLKSQIREKINSYITAVDSARDFKVDAELKKGILRVAMDELNFNSTKYQEILVDSILDGYIFTTKDLESFSPEEIERVYKDLLNEKVVPDKEYAKYINSDLYKLQKRLRDFENFDGFFEKIITLEKFNQDTLRIELLGDSNLSPRVNRKMTSQLLPMLKEYQEGCG